MQKVQDMGIDTRIYFNKKDLKKADWLVFFHAIELYTKLFATRWYWMRDVIFDYPITPLKSKEILSHLKNLDFSIWDNQKKKYVSTRTELSYDNAQANQQIKYLFEYVCPTVRIILQSDAEKPYKNKNYILGYDLIATFQKGLDKVD